MLLEGLHIRLTTPFHSDGRLNTPKLASNVARYSKTPAAGLIVLGPNAEPTLLSDDETREVLRTAAAAAAPEKVLIAGIARDSGRSTIALANFASDQHYDAILIGVPSQSTLRQRELLTYFQTVADQSPIPVVLLNSNTPRIPTETVAELAAHPNIFALFDTASQPTEIEAILKHTASIKREVTVTPTFTAVTARMLHAFASASSRATLISANSLTASATAVEPPPAFAPLRTRTKTVGFQLISGGTSTILDSLHNGATGIAPAFAACAPQACYEVFAAWKDDDQPLADEKNIRLQQAANLAESSPGILKFGCDLNGYFGGLPRLPHLPPTGEQRADLERLMQGMSN
jgi:4-hydroxy-2-oxoglutarate aldolase